MSVTNKAEPKSTLANVLSQSSNSHLQAPDPFCALCLRKRPPSGQFYRYNPENSATFCQVMAEILGYPFWLENFAVCRGCWSMVQLIEHFRQCCFVAKTWIDRYGVGMKTEEDEWLSGEILERIERLQTVIQNQTQRIGTNEDHVVDVQPTCSETSVEQIKAKTAEFEEPLLTSSGLTRNNETREDDETTAEENLVAANLGILDCSKELDEPPEQDPDLRPMETEYPECLNCQEIFDTEAELQKHSKLCEVEESDQGRKFTCPICSASFDQFKDVAVHVGSHKESESKLNGKKGFTPEKLQSINKKAKRCIIMQNPQKTFKKKVVYCCAICPAKFWSADELLKHTNKKHPIDNHQEKDNRKGRYVCSTCRAKFVLKSALEIHQKFSHRVLKLDCPNCDQKFWKNNDLVRHITNVHGKDTLTRHLENQQAKADLQNRIRKQHEHGKRFQTLQCPVCSEEFTSINLLSIHIWTHTKHKDLAQAPG